MIGAGDPVPARATTAARLVNLLLVGLLGFAISSGAILSLSRAGYARSDFAAFLVAGRAASAGANPHRRALKET